MDRTTIGRLAVIAITIALLFAFIGWMGKIFLTLPSTATSFVAEYGNSSIYGDLPGYLVAIASWFSYFLSKPYAIALLCFLSLLILALEMRRS